jgi:hypothetical protein
VISNEYSGIKKRKEAVMSSKQIIKDSSTNNNIRTIAIPDALLSLTMFYPPLFFLCSYCLFISSLIQVGATSSAAAVLHMHA